MARLSKDDLLSANDLSTREVELPSIGGSVVVRGLSAAYSNQAQSEAVEMVQDPENPRGQVARVNIPKLEAIQVFHGLVEPKLDSVEEARRFLEQCGPAAYAVTEAIDDLSGLDKEAVAQAEAQFRGGVDGPEGDPGDVGDGGSVSDGVGDSGSDVSVRAGVEAGEVGKRAD